MALALEVLLGDALLQALQDGGGARAVAKLRLLAPEEAFGEPLVEGQPQEPFLGLVSARELPPAGRERLREIM